MKPLKILVAMKDGGGMAAVWPIVQALYEDAGVIWIVASTKSVAGDQIERMLPFMTILETGDPVDDWKMVFFRSDDADDVARRVGIPDLFITSKDSGGGIGRDLVPYMRALGVPTFVVEDFWGTRLKTDWADPKYRPDYMLVNDMIGKQIVLDCWPDFKDDQVLVAGYASLDRWVTINPKAEEKAVREKLGLERGIPIVLFVGQGYGTGAALTEVGIALNSIGTRCYFVPRLHPRMLSGESFAEETPLCHAAIESFTGGRLVEDSGACSMDSLIAACASIPGSVVVAMFSTAIAIDAAAIRAPAISVFFPEIGEKSYWDEMQMTEFAPEGLGTVAVARDRESLRENLLRALVGVLNLEAKQSEHFKLDGQNARRAAEAIYSVLKLT